MLLPARYKFGTAANDSRYYQPGKRATCARTHAFVHAMAFTQHAPYLMYYNIGIAAYKSLPAGGSQRLARTGPQKHSILQRRCTRPMCVELAHGPLFSASQHAHRYNKTWHCPRLHNIDTMVINSRNPRDKNTEPCSLESVRHSIAAS